MITVKDKNKDRVVRHKRVRNTVVGTTERPRLSVYRSLSNIYAQSIDDVLSAFESCDIVIYDATNRTRKARRKLVETIQKYYDCLVYCVFMYTPLEVALERNANRDKSIQVPPAVIHRMFDTFEPPREENEEYFKEIYIIYPKIFDINKEMWYNIIVNEMKGNLKNEI